MLQFSENLARGQGKSSLRLDVFTGNSGAVSMYSNAGYRQVGQIEFPFREVPYMCYEKLL